VKKGASPRAAGQREKNFMDFSRRGPSFFGKVQWDFKFFNIFPSFRGKCEEGLFWVGKSLLWQKAFKRIPDYLRRSLDFEKGAFFYTIPLHFTKRMENIAFRQKNWGKGETIC